MPYLCRTATKKPYACICNQCVQLYFSRNIVPKQDNHISTGIYRCSILDIGMKFCENFKASRISADKRFSLFFCFPPSTLRPGLPNGLRCKGNDNSDTIAISGLIIFRCDSLFVWMARFQHLVSLHHAAEGEAAVILVFLTAPE